MTTDKMLYNLQAEVWNLYKDVFGVRPRDWTQEDWDSVEFLESQKQGLISYIERMTPEQKIAEGWGSDIFGDE